VAPNIYYLGIAGVVQYGELRIGLESTRVTTMGSRERRKWGTGRGRRELRYTHP